VYAKPQDIDIYVGGLSETPVAGGVIGDTFSCFLGKHFRNRNRVNPNPHCFIEIIKATACGLKEPQYYPTSCTTL
jgi:hypothetical protein